MKRSLIVVLSLVMFGLMSCDNGGSSTSGVTNDWGAWQYTWGNWSVTTPATETSEGVETRTGTRTRTCYTTAQTQIEQRTETRPIPVVVVQHFAISPIGAHWTVTGRGTVVGPEIVIPDTTPGGHPLTAIFDDAFRNEGITSVTIGNNIQVIQVGAFADNPGLTSVVIPSSVTGIAANAFTGTGLTSVVIPPTVNVIAPGAFDPHVQLIGWPRD